MKTPIEPSDQLTARRKRAEYVRGSATSQFPTLFWRTTDLECRHMDAGHRPRLAGL